MVNEDLMATQSGGEGETIQATPVTTETPEQYDINIKPIQQEEQSVDTTIEQPNPVSNIPDLSVEQPTPIKDEKPLTEVDLGEEVIAPLNNDLLSVDFTEYEPKPKPDMTGFDVYSILEPEEIDPTPDYEIDDPSFDPNADLDAPAIIEEEDDDFAIHLDEESQFAKSLKPVEPEQPIEQPVVNAVPEFNLATAFNDLNSSLIEEKEKPYWERENPYSVGTVADYQPSAAVSKNFLNGYAKVTNLDIKEVETLVSSNIGADGDIVDEVGRIKSDMSYDQTVYNSAKSAIESNDATSLLKQESVVNELAKIYGKSTEEMSAYIKANGPKVLNRAVKTLESSISSYQKQLNDIEDPKTETKNKPLSAYEVFSRKIKTDATKLKNEYGKQYGKQYNQLVDFVAGNGFRYHVKKSIDNPDYKYPPSATLNYKIKQMNLSKEAEAVVRDLANRVYEEEVNNYYTKTGKGDFLSFSGFSIEASQINKQDKRKLVSARDSVVNEVIPKYEKNVSDWEAKNNPVFDSKVKSITEKANETYQNGISYIAQNNPEISNLIQEYQVKLANEQDPNLRSSIVKEFETKLNTNEQIAQLKEKRDRAVDAAINQATSDYMGAKSSFLKSNYNEAKEEFHDKFKKATFDVYRQGVNGDVNMYVNIDKATRTSEFKKMGFYEKRRFIAEQWLNERKQLSTYLLGNTEYYPKTPEEGSKHWTEWTGRRPKTEAQIKQHKKEYNNRIGKEAQERFYFYAVDELLMPTDNKMSPFMLKSMAKDEVAKIELLIKTGGQDVLFENATGKKPNEFNRMSQDIVSGIAPEAAGTYGDYKQALDTWKEILSHPENDDAWWSDLSKGFMNGVSVPVLGSFVGMSKQFNLKNAVENYQNGTMSMAEISLVHANSALNKLNQINPPSKSYQVGNMLGQTTTIAAEMLLTGGVFKAASGSVKALVDDVATASVKALYKSSDNATTSYLLEVMSNPANIERVQNVTGFIAGTFAQNATLLGNNLKTAAERMTPEMTASYGGVYDPLIAQISNQSEEAPEALLKAFGVNWANLMIERAGPVLAGGKTKQAFLSEMGSADFLKRTVVGRWMRNQGFKSIDEASEYAAKNGISFSNLIDEALVEELLLSKNVEALITGDSEMFDYSSDEVITTIAGVGLFSFAMNGHKAIKTRIFNNETDTEIETTNEDGTRLITKVSKDTWNQFNALVGKKDFDLQKMVTFLESHKLPSDQENALLNVYSKVNGSNLRNDPKYQMAKKKFEEDLGEEVDDSFLDEGDAILMKEKEVELQNDPSTPPKPESEQVTPIDTNSDSVELKPESDEIISDQIQESQDLGETVSEMNQSVNEDEFLDSMKIPDEAIQYEETVLSNKVDESINDDIEVVSETENNPFVAYSELMKKKTPVSVSKAKKDFENKYPEQMNRVKEIDSNFGDIVSQLESRNLLQKRC